MFVNVKDSINLIVYKKMLNFLQPNSQVLVSSVFFTCTEEKLSEDILGSTACSRDGQIVRGTP